MTKSKTETINHRRPDGDGDGGREKLIVTLRLTFYMDL